MCVSVCVRACSNRFPILLWLSRVSTTLLMKKAQQLYQPVCKNHCWVNWRIGTCSRVQFFIMFIKHLNTRSLSQTVLKRRLNSKTGSYFNRMREKSVFANAYSTSNCVNIVCFPSIVADTLRINAGQTSCGPGRKLPCLYTALQFIACEQSRPCRTDTRRSYTLARLTQTQGQARNDLSDKGERPRVKSTTDTARGSEYLAPGPVAAVTVSVPIS